MLEEEGDEGAMTSWLGTNLRLFGSNSGVSVRQSWRRFKVAVQAMLLKEFIVKTLEYSVCTCCFKNPFHNGCEIYGTYTR